MSKLASLLIAASLAACGGGGYYRSSGTVAVTAHSSAPDMAYVSDGVYVIADYDEPIFYADGYYWYNNNGYWYRSGSYTGGWVSVSTPSYRVARIGNPYAYRHYRPRNYVVRNRPVPVQRIDRPWVRDHRAARRGGYYRTR
jgi:hypothetical protein